MSIYTVSFGFLGPLRAADGVVDSDGFGVVLPEPDDDGEIAELEGVPVPAAVLTSFVVLFGLHGISPISDHFLTKPLISALS